MATYYHGSSKLFDRFDLAHALEGDGKVKFGYGVYTFVRDLYFPVFDLLHFNSFWSEVHVAYQHFPSRVEW